MGVGCDRLAALRRAIAPIREGLCHAFAARGYFK